MMARIHHEQRTGMDPSASKRNQSLIVRGPLPRPSRRLRHRHRCSRGRIERPPLRCSPAPCWCWVVLGIHCYLCHHDRQPRRTTGQAATLRAPAHRLLDHLPPWPSRPRRDSARCSNRPLPPALGPYGCSWSPFNNDLFNSTHPSARGVEFATVAVMMVAATGVRRQPLISTHRCRHSCQECFAQTSLSA